MHRLVPETGWQFAHGPDIAPEGDRPSGPIFGRWCCATGCWQRWRINPQIPAAALEQAAHTPADGE